MCHSMQRLVSALTAGSRSGSQTSAADRRKSLWSSTAVVEFRLCTSTADGRRGPVERILLKFTTLFLRRRRLHERHRRRFTLVAVADARRADRRCSALPVLVGLGARWRRARRAQELTATGIALRIENDSYRDATGQLASQISALQAAVDEIGARAAVDPAASRAMEKLPAVVKSRAMGGGSGSGAPVLGNALGSPDTAFGVLRDLLGRHRGSAGAGAVGRRAAAGARRRHAVDLAGRRLAVVAVRRPPRSRSPAATTSIPASTSPRRRASRSRARRRHGRRPPARTAATATSSSSITASASSPSTATCRASRSPAASRSSAAT